jgi:hypothetical protein
MGYGADGADGVDGTVIFDLTVVGVVTAPLIFTPGIGRLGSSNGPLNPQAPRVMATPTHTQR